MPLSRTLKSAIASIVLAVASPGQRRHRGRSQPMLTAGLELGGEAIIIDNVQVGSVFYTAVCGCLPAVAAGDGGRHVPDPDPSA